MLERTALAARPARRTPPEDLDPARRHADRRLRVAARRQLARGDARSVGARSGDPRLSRGRERLRQGRARAHRGAAADAVRRDEGAHQGGRLHGAEPGRAVSPITSAIAKAGSIRSSAASRARAAPRRCCSTATRSRPARPTSSSAPRAHSPDHRLLAWSADDKGSEYDTLRVRDLGDRRRPADIDPGCRRLAGVDRGFIRLLLRAARRQSSSLARLSASARHAGGGRRAGLRGEGRAAFSSRSAALQSGRFAEISVHDHETSECWLIDLADPRREAARWSRRAKRRCNTTSSITRTGTAKRRW